MPQYLEETLKLTGNKQPCKEDSQTVYILPEGMYIELKSEHDWKHSAESNHCIYFYEDWLDEKWIDYSGKERTGYVTFFYSTYVGWFSGKDEIYIIKYHGSDTAGVLPE